MRVRGQDHWRGHAGGPHSSGSALRYLDQPYAAPTGAMHCGLSPRGLRGVVTISDLSRALPARLVQLDGIHWGEVSPETASAVVSEVGQQGARPAVTRPERHARSTGLAVHERVVTVDAR